MQNILQVIQDQTDEAILPRTPLEQPRMPQINEMSVGAHKVPNALLPRSCDLFMAERAENGSVERRCRDAPPDMMQCQTAPALAVLIALPARPATDKEIPDLDREIVF